MIGASLVSSTRLTMFLSPRNVLLIDTLQSLLLATGRLPVWISSKKIIEPHSTSQFINTQLQPASAIRAPTYQLIAVVSLLKHNVDSVFHSDTARSTIVIYLDFNAAVNTVLYACRAYVQTRHLSVTMVHCDHNYNATRGPSSG